MAQIAKSAKCYPIYGFRVVGLGRLADFPLDVDEFLVTEGRQLRTSVVTPGCVKKVCEGLRLLSEVQLRLLFEQLRRLFDFADAAAGTLVERFDIESFSDFAAK